MKINDVRNKQFPLNKRILVFAHNIQNPRWVIDEFFRAGPSDHDQIIGNLYPHNVSHWCELPEDPELPQKKPL
jgi:hypothetical protein